MPPQQSGWRRFHQVDALADADIHVVVDVGDVVVVDIDVDLPPLQSNLVCSNVDSVANVDVYVDMPPSSQAVENLMRFDDYFVSFSYISWSLYFKVVDLNQL